VKSGTELWGLSTFYNPGHDAGRLALLRNFADRARSQGLKLLIVELAFGDDAHVLDRTDTDILVQLRTQSVLWQKERLLNIALGHLDAGCRKVAWLDADVLFENADWVVETDRLLDEYPVVQPFHIAYLLPKGHTSPEKGYGYGPKEGQWMYGMAYVMSRINDRRRALKRYEDSGHCGLAWAARRDLLERHGFYDRRIDGGGDLSMSHAMYENIDTWKHSHWEGDSLSQALLDDIVRWGRAFGSDVQGKVGYVPGSVLHLWHGNWADRQYGARARWLAQYGFDPATDIAEDEAGCWRWASEKPELHRRYEALFAAGAEGQGPVPEAEA